jgi:hypothetical protein
VRSLRAALGIVLLLFSFTALSGEVGVSWEGGGSPWGWVSLGQEVGRANLTERLEVEISPIRLVRARGEISWGILSSDTLSSSVRLAAGFLGTGRLDLAESLNVAWAPWTWLRLRGGERAYWTGPGGLPRGTVWARGALHSGGLRLEAGLDLPIPLARPHCSVTLTVGSGVISLSASGTPFSLSSLSLALRGSDGRAAASFRIYPSPSARATISLDVPSGRLRLSGSLGQGGFRADASWSITLGSLKLELGIRASPAGAGLRASARYLIPG